ncbi:MAG: phosphoglycerate dehydrogenase [Caldilineales bacterium]
MSYRILIADKLDQEGVDLLRPHAEVVERPTITQEELVAAISEFDALLVRSRPQVSAEVLQAAATTGRLRVVGRAGVGVDNIDVPAATAAGVTVVNAPTGNTVAAAEHAVAMLLALARHIPAADHSVRSGEWKRSQFMGTEVRNKRLGLLGLGRIASLVAERCQGFGMEVVAHDPYVGKDYAANIGVQLVDFEELLQRSDFISLHVPATAETRGLFNTAELARCKPGVFIINCARGGVIDEAALLAALDAGQVAGAALDVYAQEPPADTPLLHHPKIVLTPHIAGSTHEAQRQVAVDVAEQVVDVLQGRLARYAINTPIIAPKDLEALTPYIDLAERLGRFLVQLEPGTLDHMELNVYGPIAELDVAYLEAAALKGLLDGKVAERVNLVNARLIARQRGLNLAQRRKRHHSQRYESLITLAVGNGKRQRTVSGAILQEEPHIVGIDDLWVDFVASGHLLLTWHHDRPGIVGRIGTLLGQNDVNIAFMHLGRRSPRGEAIMVLGLDEMIPESLYPEILNMPHNYSVKAILL